MKNITLTITLSALCIPFLGFSQMDGTFSQFMNSPLEINPANTGHFQGTVRAGANFRRQWENIATPYQNIGAWGDAQIIKDLFDKDIFSLGVNVNQDQVGNSEFSRLDAGVNLGYTKIMDRKAEHFISLGARVGYGQHSISSGGLTWDNQWTPTGFNTGLPTGENDVNENLSFMNFGGGVKYFYGNQEGTIKAYGGAAMYHINRPDVGFFNQEINLDRRFIYETGFFYKADNEVLIFHPQAFWMQQGVQRNVIIGSDLRFILSGATRNTGFLNEVTLALGLYHRLGDSFIPMVKLATGGFELGISYDATVGNLTRINNGFGGPEFSLIYKAKYKSGTGKRGVNPKFL
mgnify:CR=1 FL=1